MVLEFHRLYPDTLFLKLYPACRDAGCIANRAKDDMFLAAGRNHGQFWKRRIAEQGSHLSLIRLAQRYPIAIHDKVTVIAHSLRLVFAKMLLKRDTGFIKPEQTIATDDITRQ